VSFQRPYLEETKMSRKNRKSQSIKIAAFAKVEDLALSKLVRSARNVRHTHSYQSVDELA